MKKQLAGKILKLCISKKDHKNRVEKEQLGFDLGGVCEDKFNGKDILRSVLIATKESYDLAHKNDIDISYGQLGENILTDFNPYSLEIGTQLQIGDAILEISQPCTLCNGLSKVNNKLPKLLKSDRGIFAKVISKGSAKIGDEIFILD
ncbi:MAG: MOSC domain-containing protein [Campylobacterota bacterium]|nr:MOSC domain-containing protein [Campylobacterota bacterium]